MRSKRRKSTKSKTRTLNYLVDISNTSSSCAYGCGSGTEKYIAAKADKEIVVGDIVLFFKYGAHCALLRRFEILKKNKITKTDYEGQIPFGFAVKDSNVIVKVPLASAQTQWSYASCFQRKCLFVMFSAKRWA